MRYIALWLFLLIHSSFLYGQPGIVVATASDSDYYTYLINFIGGLHRVDFKNLQEIMVFDLGLSKKDKDQLSTIAKVGMYSIQSSYPHLLKKVVTNHDKKTVPGWYAWKPAAIKQALDKYPTVLWMDAGTTILNSIEPLFKHVQQNNFFAIEVDHSIAWCTTQFVRSTFKLDTPERSFILKDTCRSVAAGHIGFTRKIYKDLVLPWYRCAHDLRFFADDGSAPGGFGNARYEQTLLSILVRLLHLPVMPPEGWMHLRVDGKNIPFHMHWHYQGVIPETNIFQSRTGLFYDHTSYIQYKEKQ